MFSCLIFLNFHTYCTIHFTVETNSISSELDPTASPFQPKTSGTPSESDSEIREINKELEAVSLDDQFGITWVVKW